MYKLFCIALVFGIVAGKLGIDASAGPFSVDSMKCMKQKGFTFAIFRAYRQLGKVDPHVVANVKAANEGGMEDVSVYIYPCAKCNDPKEQVIRTVEALKNSKYSTLWLDIERQGWNLNDKAHNRQFVQAMFDEAVKHGKKVGVYSGIYSWRAIVGDDWHAGAKFPLWWPHWDKKPSFKNFKSYGGWKSAFMKQYDHDHTDCKVKYDLNYVA